MSLQRNTVFLILLLLCGCTSMPKNKPLFDSILSETDNPAVARSYDAKWWEDLNDPAIDILVDKAFSTNPTLEQALARIDEANAQLGILRSGHFPTVGVNASVSQNYDGSVDAGEKSRTTSIKPSLSWELDLFGRVRNSNKAAESRLNARTADSQNTRIMLASDVATTTLNFRVCRSSSLVLENDITSKKETLNLIHKKVEAGFSTQTEENSARRNLALASIELALQNELCQNYLNALTAFSGMGRALILELFAQTQLDEIERFIPESPEFPEPIEATALMNHPSIRTAAYDAEAAWMDISVAKAERLPRLDLSALLTGQWIRTAGTTLDFTTWALEASFSGILFDSGLGAANVDASEARYRGALAVLEGALRTALQEAQDALAAQQSANERYEAATIALKTAQSSFTANEVLWKNGSASLLELEDSRRQLLAAQINLITAKRDRATAWIALHCVLGEPIHPESKNDEKISIYDINYLYSYIRHCLCYAENYG